MIIVFHMSITYVSYTHTDYSDIWCLMMEGVEQLSGAERVLFCNRVPEDPKIMELYNRVITYDDSLTYPARIAQCLEHISTEYVMFVHDIDVIVSFDMDRFADIMNTIVEYELDRLFFGMVQPCSDMICNNWLVLARAKHSPIFALPYDVGPSVWKRSVFLEFMEKYSDQTYRTIETSAIQDDLQNYRCYAFAPCPNYFPIYHLVRPMTSLFIFMHILASGKWFDPICYMDLQTVFLQKINSHNINMVTRGVGNGFHLFHVSRSLEPYHLNSNT